MDLDQLRRRAPGIAALVALFSPLLAIIAAGMVMLGVQLRAGAGVGLLLWGLLSLGATAVLLTRRKGAFAVIGGLALFGLLAGEVVSCAGSSASDSQYGETAHRGRGGRASRRGYAPGDDPRGRQPSRTPFVLLLVAAGLAGWRNDAFHRDWDWPRTLPDLRKGAEHMLKRSPGAAVRALAGVGCCLFAFLLVGVHMGGKSPLGATTLMGSLLTGIGLLVTSVRLPEE